MAEKEFKVVLLGEGCVGKTSLCLSYVQNAFNDKHITTIKAYCLVKRLNIDGRRVQLNIWDTAGQERFHALGPIYYRDAHGALLVYDITDRDSFAKMQNWVKELRKMLGTNVTLIIAGNKSDLERSRVVTIEEAEAYATSVGAKHFSTSAKLNKGVEELFLDLSKRMLQNAPDSVTTSIGPTGSGAPPKEKTRLQIAAEEPDKQSGCC